MPSKPIGKIRCGNRWVKPRVGMRVKVIQKTLQGPLRIIMEMKVSEGVITAIYDTHAMHLTVKRDDGHVLWVSLNDLRCIDPLVHAIVRAGGLNEE